MTEAGKILCLYALNLIEFPRRSFWRSDVRDMAKIHRLFMSSKLLGPVTISLYKYVLNKIFFKNLAKLNFTGI